MGAGAPTAATFQPQQHQSEAIEAVVGALAAPGRAQVTMACGSGKTLVGRWSAQRLNPQTVLVLCPSLALVAQTVRAWRKAAGWPFEALLVCSDPTTAAGAQERADGEPDAPWWSTYGAKVTLLPEHVRQALARARTGRPLVIFSTYHSAPTVAQAVTEHGRPIDLLVADEAHHLAGSPREEFRCVVDGRLPVERALFMTATRVVSRVSGSLSMDEESIFGPVVHRLTFSDAIERGLLTDYRVVVYEASEGYDGRSDAISALVHGASGDDRIRRVLSFHGRVTKGRAFAAELDGHTLPDGRTVRARAVAGVDSVARRERALAVLDEVGDEEIALVASARCLSEGVDLPAVDAVIFADPRSSVVDITQAVGRVLRRAPGKTVGTVLVPVVIGDGIDDDIGGNTGRYRHVWTVLQTLKAMDPALADELDAIERGASRHGATHRAKVQFRVPTLADVRTLIPRSANLRTVPWEDRIAGVREYAIANGHTRLPKSTSLGLWCDMQRRRHRAGAMPRAEAEELRAIPHWTWDAAHDRWVRQLEQVLSAGTLDLHDDDAMTVRMSVRGAGEPRTVGQWCAAQRAARRQGLLERERAVLLSAVKGWTWSAVEARDGEHVDLLREYVAWKRHANVPEDWSEGDLHLGAWLRQVRRARVTKNLSRPLLDEVELAVSAVAGDQDGKLRWLSAQVTWSLGLEALRQFVTREGHARVPWQHVERLADTDVALSTWCTRQRFSHRHGELGPRVSAMLETVPGWQWEVQPAPRVLLDIGDSRHGTRTGYVKGCRCDECTRANLLDRQKRAAAAARGESVTRLVDASPSRGRLRVLLGQGASMKGIARALRLNTKTVQELANGTTLRVLPETEAAINALTVADVHAASAGMAGVLVDAAATWAQVEEMLALGWPKSWISREAGMGATLQLRRDQVSARNAERIAVLRARVGDTRAPARKPREKLPTLDEVLRLAA